MSSLTTVFVSGGTGFIAQHIVKQLLKRHYRVIASVRSRAKGEKLRDNLQSENFSTTNFLFEIVPDIGIKGAFDDVLKANSDISVFLHTASPVTFDVTDIKKDLLDPAIEGTRNALEAISKYGPQIKRVVITSSIAAIQTFGRFAKEGESFDENSWNPISYEESLESPMYGYAGSKTFAEKTAWEYVSKNKPNFTLSVINPAMVFGPQAFPITNKAALNHSSQAISKLLELKPNDPVPEGKGAFVDVRDVAHAHIVAFERDDAQGKRLILLTGPYNNQAIVNITREDFPTLDLILPRGDPEKGELHDISKRWNNEATKKILGFEFIGLEKSVHDSVQQILGDSL